MTCNNLPCGASRTCKSYYIMACTQFNRREGNPHARVKKLRVKGTLGLQAKFLIRGNPSLESTIQ